ncbi:MAG: hypothetical protein JNM81_05370, partial [Rhodospirillaceae bacterium]|nr:hypothetical protein [Rhodospirillaceae bacterium]
DKVAAEGFAAMKVPDQNHCAIAVPIMVGGEVFAVLGVTFYPTAMTLKQAADTFVGPLKEASSRMAKLLSDWRAERAAADKD